MRNIYEFDSTYYDIMINVLDDITSGRSAVILGIDGSVLNQYSRAALFGIDWVQWSTIRLVYLNNL